MRSTPDEWFIVRCATGKCLRASFEESNLFNFIQYLCKAATKQRKLLKMPIIFLIDLKMLNGNECFTSRTYSIPFYSILFGLLNVCLASFFFPLLSFQCSSSLPPMTQCKQTFLKLTTIRMLQFFENYSNVRCAEYIVLNYYTRYSLMNANAKV